MRFSYRKVEMEGFKPSENHPGFNAFRDPFNRSLWSISETRKNYSIVRANNKKWNRLSRNYTRSKCPWPADPRQV